MNFFSCLSVRVCVCVFRFVEEKHKTGQPRFKEKNKKLNKQSGLPFTITVYRSSLAELRTLSI